MSEDDENGREGLLNGFDFDVAYNTKLAEVCLGANVQFWGLISQTHACMRGNVLGRPNNNGCPSLHSRQVS